MRNRLTPAVCLTFTCCNLVGLGAEPIKYIQPNVKTGLSQAVVIENTGLLHTPQLFPRDDQGRVIADTNATLQVTRLFEQLDATVAAAAGSSIAQVVKINAYLADLAALAPFEAALSKRFNGKHQPAVSFVVSRLPHQNCLVALDAVAVLPFKSATVAHNAPADTAMGMTSLCPPGSLIYVAGQAEKGASLAEATRLTLASLQKTLQVLGRDKNDIIQVKSFLSPMDKVAEAQREVTAFFGEKATPPMTWVEWTAPLIEIEVIAWAGKVPAESSVEYFTPPGMTKSPVYSKVATANSSRLIYVSGLYSRTPGDAEHEVKDVFEQLQNVVQQAGSDLQHLVKATYYCSADETSTKLNQLRPNYYDPARPPAASKAMVKGVGRAARGLTIDMIAVPHE